MLEFLKAYVFNEVRNFMITIKTQQISKLSNGATLWLCAHTLTHARIRAPTRTSLNCTLLQMVYACDSVCMWYVCNAVEKVDLVITFTPQEVTEVPILQILISQS